jgi:homoserine dehydrogenase
MSCPAPVPSPLQHLSVDAFMARLPELDAAIAARAAAAAAAGAVLRYAAVVEGGAARVGLTAVPRDSPLGRLKGTDNLVELASAVYSPLPLVLQGRGAGAAATAAGVLADVLELHDCR